MSTGKKVRATRRVEATKDDEHFRVRVLVASSLPMTAAGLGSLLRAHPCLEIIASSAGQAQLQDVIRDTEPDVLMLDIDEYVTEDRHILALVARLAAMVPIIALTANASASWIGHALRAGVRGLLRHAVSGDELAFAARAAAAGLVVLSPEINEILLARGIEVDSDEFEPQAESLTPREQEVLAMLAQGLLNKEIADRLHISEHTVKFHISSIMGKLDASSRTEAVTRGIRRGLVFL